MEGAGQPAVGAAEGGELTESGKKRKAEADCGPSLLAPSAVLGGVGKRRASPEAEVSMVLPFSFAHSGRKQRSACFLLCLREFEQRLGNVMEPPYCNTSPCLAILACNLAATGWAPSGRWIPARQT